jgi:hypothetical protein
MNAGAEGKLRVKFAVKRIGGTTAFEILSIALSFLLKYEFGAPNYGLRVVPYPIRLMRTQSVSRLNQIIEVAREYSRRHFRDDVAAILLNVARQTLNFAMEH